MNGTFQPNCRDRGFTLVEILIAVSIIGLLAGLLIPAVQLAFRHRENAAAASRLRTLVGAFESYHSEFRRWPAEKDPGVVPDEIEPYLNSLGIDWFAETNAVGGRWDWGNNQFSGVAASLAIAGASLPSAQMTTIDKLIDDGNLSTGRFRHNGNEHYYYILEQ